MGDYSDKSVNLKIMVIRSMKGGKGKQGSQKETGQKAEQDGVKKLFGEIGKDVDLHSSATGKANSSAMQRGCMENRRDHDEIEGEAGTEVATGAGEVGTLGRMQDGGEATRSAEQWWCEAKMDMERMVGGLEERLVKRLEERLVEILERKVVRILESFKEDVGNDLRGVKEEMQGRVDGLASEVGAVEERMSEMEERIRGLEEGEQDAMAELIRLREENESLRVKVTDVEARSRRSNLRCFGVREGAEGENVAEFMTELIKGEFDSLREVDLGMQRCHRALGPIPGVGATPRSIVMFFQDFRIKEKIIAEAWTKGRKVMYGGKRLYFDHDYPAETLEKRKKYAPIRKCLSENKIKFSTPQPAKMKVFFKEGAETYASAEEAREKLTAKGYTIEEPPTARRGATPATGTQRNTWQRAGKDKDGDVKRRQRIREKLRVFARD